MRLEELKANQECTCPLCKSHNVDYDSSETDGDAMWYPCECQDCGATWQECYNIVFTQVDEVFDKDYKKVYSSFDEILDK